MYCLIESSAEAVYFIYPRITITVICIHGLMLGWWFMHCHLEQHQIQGMALILQEGEDDYMNRPPDAFPTCGSFEWSEAEFRDRLKGVSDEFGGCMKFNYIIKYY